MKTGESSFQAVPFCPSFSVFSFLFQTFWVFSSDGGRWTGDSQKPGKILKNRKNDSPIELP